MTTTWILIAHRGGARLFEHTGRSTGLKLLHDIPHPEGRLKNQDINADKHGRTFDSKGKGRHAKGTAQDPVDNVANQFAHQLAHLLDDGRTHNRYHHLVLVAAPRFLGELRGVLDHHTQALIKAELDKDLSAVNERDLPAHLADVVPL